MKAFPRIIFSHKESSIAIRDHLITIVGKIEDVAVAFAEDILKRKRANPDYTLFDYMAIDVVIENGEVILRLWSQDSLDKQSWNLLKKGVEKICNNLTAFM